MKKRILFFSTPVGPLGSGLGGGVELSLKNLAEELSRRGWQIEIVAPANSVLENFTIHQIEGSFQKHALADEESMQEPGVLEAMWKFVQEHQSFYDLILSFSYDALSFKRNELLMTPLAHWVSVCAGGNFSTDLALKKCATAYPNNFSFLTRVQFESYKVDIPANVTGMGFDLSLYDFCEYPKNFMAWAGRISPEKGLEDAFEVSRKSKIPLKVFGFLQDKIYWKRICEVYTDVTYEYCGFLSTREFQSKMREASFLIITSHCLEAFGNVVVEALACGVPVICYDKGGQSEIIKNSETGFVVPYKNILVTSQQYFTKLA